MKRLSTLTFARRACARLDHGAKLREALDLAMVPDILDTMDAHDGARFFVLACYQSAKSAIGQCRLARNHWIRPRPAGWYAPTIEFANKFSDEKLNPLLEAIFTGRESDFVNLALKQSKRYWKFTSGSHHILSANTENDRTGATYCDLYFDEPHLYEPGWIKQASNRRGAYPEEFTETFMSTGLTLGDGATGSEAAAIWAETDQRTWHVRCPSCKKFFEPKYLHREKEDDPESPIIGGLIYQKSFLESGLPDQNAIAATLHHQCPRCRAVCGDSLGSRFALSGRADQPRGIYVSLNPSPSPRTYGWTFNAIAIRPWLPIVIGFELAQLARKRGDLEPLGRWIREEMAGVWEPEKYLRTQKARPVGDYDMQTDTTEATPWPGEALDPDGRPVRCLTVDVQMDYFVAVVRMWGKNGASRLRHCAKVSSASAVRDIQMRHEIPSQRVFLDGRYDTENTRRICAAYGWRVLMGEKDKATGYHHPESGTYRIYDIPRWINAYQGTAHAPVNVAQILFNKQKALTRLHILRGLTDSDGHPLFTAARNAPEWYHKENEAHYRIKKTTPEGQVYFVWHGFHEDHAGDCEVEQVIFSSMAGLIGAESIETVATDQPIRLRPAGYGETAPISP